MYNDRIIIRARESGIELGGEYNYTWFNDGSLVKNAPEPSIDEYMAYNYTGQKINTAYNKAGQSIAAIYPYQ